jgi:hypothetical protein
MMHAIIEPSVLIWNENEFYEETESIQVKYDLLTNELISLIRTIEENSSEYIAHKILFRSEFIDMLFSQIPFKDLSEIVGYSTKDLQEVVFNFLVTIQNDYEIYYNEDNTEIASAFLQPYYSEGIKNEVTYMINHIKNVEDITIIGLKESSFYTYYINNKLQKEIPLTTEDNSARVKIFDSESELNSYFDMQYNFKNYQGVLKTGKILVLGTECIEKYFNRLKRKFNESPKHKPPTGWGTHIFISDKDADDGLQTAVWDTERENSHFLYANIDGIIHEFPPTNIIDNSYHGYPICDEETYIRLQEKFKESHPSYKAHATWQSADISGALKRKLLS